MLVKKTIGWNVNICVAMSPIGPAWHEFEVSVPSVLTITGHIGLRHRRIQPGPMGIGWGLRFGIASASTQAGLQRPVGVGYGMPRWIEGAKTGNNLMSMDQHYDAPAICGYELLEPGWHRIELWANCHPDAKEPQWNHPQQSWLEINGNGGAKDPYNCIVYRTEPQ